MAEFFKQYYHMFPKPLKDPELYYLRKYKKLRESFPTEVENLPKNV